MPPIRDGGPRFLSGNRRYLPFAGTGNLRRVSQSGTRVTGLCLFAWDFDDGAAGMNGVPVVTNRRGLFTSPGERCQTQATGTGVRLQLPERGQTPDRGMGSDPFSDSQRSRRSPTATS